jgi:hypothetical protein
MSPNPTKGPESAVLRSHPGPHPLKSKLCKQHRSVNPGQCPACVLAEYYEKKLALWGEELDMLRGTIDRMHAEKDKS